MVGAYPYMDLNAKYGKLLLRCLQLTFPRKNSNVPNMTIDPNKDIYKTRQVHVK